jgi:hypothetical protein
MKKIYILLMTVMMSPVCMDAQTVIYSNDFENGADDATIVGSGQIITDTDATFGKVFHNAVGGQEFRQNYLLLPSDILSSYVNMTHTELTISFWVNMGTATDYFWTPLFTGYGDAPDFSTNPNGVNAYPVFALQSRLLAVFNWQTYSDFSDAENVESANSASTAWLDDQAWHFYTATFTPLEAKIYIDGVLQNSWTFTGNEGSSIDGLFNAGADIDYICLGGNQAFDWPDVDAAYMFDDVKIYSDALTETQINGVLTAKANATPINEVEGDSNGIVETETYYSITGQLVGDNYAALKAGIYVKKTTYSDGTIKTNKIVKAQK